MMLRVALLLLICLIPRIWSHPSDVKLPDIRPTAPQAVNGLQEAERPKQTRSVANTDTTNNNLETTIAEVQELIKSNPSYPKLTRGEILDLLENISRTDPEVAKKLNYKPRDDGKRAIMVVMPYTPDGKNEMIDFYTKPPITQIVGGDGSSTTSTTSKKPSFEADNLPLAELFPDIKKEVIYQTQTNKTNESEITIQSNKPLRRRRPELTSPSISTSTSTTLKPSTARRAQNRRRTTTLSPRFQYSEESKEIRPVQSASSSGITIVAAPNLGFENSSEKQDKKPAVKPKPFQRKRTTEKPIADSINIPNDLKTVFKDMDLVPVAFASENVQTTSTKTNPPLIQTSTTEIPDASNIADGLTPEMRELLKSFGLIPNSNEKQNDFKQEYRSEPETAQVTADSYVGFKPLPDNAPTRHDMEAFLGSFGLGRSSRKQKNKKQTTTEESGLNLDMIPEPYKEVVHDIGLKARDDRKISAEPLQKVNDKNTVFNSKGEENATQEELSKLSKLLEMIKLMEKLNGTAPETELKQIDLENLKEIVSSLNKDETSVSLDQQQGAPDPLNYDQGVTKNEVKRQQENNNSSETSTATSEDQKSSASLADLEDSFGGPKETGTEEAVTVPPPSKPKHNGFYYLVDWNTFLDIDNQKGKRVNLRFQPKVGDPKRFLSVTVP